MHVYIVRHGSREKARDLSSLCEIEHRHGNSVGGRENAYIWWWIYITIERSRIPRLFSKGDLQSLDLGFLSRLAGQLVGRKVCFLTETVARSGIM